MATDDESAEGGALLATVLRLDRDGDHAGIASYLAGGNYDPANGVFAVYRLLTEGRSGRPMWRPRSWRRPARAIRPSISRWFSAARCSATKPANRSPSNA